MIKTTSTVAASVMNKGEAKAITDRIRQAVDGLGTLVEQAHDRGAWKALGYESWQSYVSTEFGFTKQRSYQLLDHGKTTRVIAEAAGMESTAVDLSERETRDIKSDLPAVAAEVKAKVDKGEDPANAIAETVAAKRSENEKEREDKKAKQAANDAFRNENRAALPPAVQAQENAKAVAKAKKPDTASNNIIDSLVVAQDRIAELEESVRVLEKENTILSVRVKVFSEMEAEWKAGGFAEVVRGKDEVIAAQATRIERESADKVSYKRSADMWRKRAEDAGWSNDVVIDIEPRGAAHG